MKDFIRLDLIFTGQFLTQLYVVFDITNEGVLNEKPRAE